MNPTLDNMLEGIQQLTLAAKLTAGLTGPVAPEVDAGATIALALESVVRLALSSYQSALGQPMDLSKLHQIDPLV